MKGASRRLIMKMGTEYDVLNASGGTGGRDTPDYTVDGTVKGTLTSLGQPRVVTDSDGTEVSATREISVVESEYPIREAGSANGYPTKFKHPDGHVYRALDTFPADSGVTTVTVVRD